MSWWDFQFQVWWWEDTDLLEKHHVPLVWYISARKSGLCSCLLSGPFQGLQLRPLLTLNFLPAVTAVRLKLASSTLRLAEAQRNPASQKQLWLPYYLYVNWYQLSDYKLIHLCMLWDRRTFSISWGQKYASSTLQLQGSQHGHCHLEADHTKEGCARFSTLPGCTQ